MTTLPEQAQQHDGAPAHPAGRAFQAVPEWVPGSPPDAGDAGGAFRWPAHSSPPTAATLDRHRASDVAAPPPRPPGPSRLLPSPDSSARKPAVSAGIAPGDPRWGRGRSTRGSGYRSRTYYLPDELHFRMRNAWWYTQTEPMGHDSISQLVTSALRPVVEELEARYNGGRPFPEMPEQARPKARPAGRARPARGRLTVTSDGAAAQRGTR